MPDFNILALSGGGFKGLYTARIIERLEEEFKCPIAQKFDLIAGTSIGGILALGLALEIPARMLVELFTKKGSIIFSTDKFYQRVASGIIHSKYPQDGLRLALEEVFGERTISDLRHRIIIPTINFSKGGPQVFKTRHHPSLMSDCKRKLVDVALATSAAPVYFPIHRFSEGDFVDGGIVANHPGLYACIEAQKFLHIDINNIFQLHIGTLSRVFTSPGSKRMLKSGILQWNTKLLNLIFSCQEQSVDQITRFLLEDRYYSIDQDIAEDQARSVGLDKTHEKAQVILTQCANIGIQNFIATDYYKKLKDYVAVPFVSEPL